jgi:protein-S-isoprenylcysteine O-methyltransferase Ste14
MIGDTLAFRLFVPVFLLVFVLAGGPLGAWLFKRKHGFDPLALDDPEPVLEFGERVRDGLFVVALGLTTVNVFWPDIRLHVGTFDGLLHPVVRAVGVATLIVSLVVVRLGQIQLRSSWRHGLDRARPPDELIRDGLFAVSRNPIFLGMQLLALGVFLCMPNAITLVIPVVAFVILGTRVRVEEAFLTELWGEEYEEYRRATARWFLWPKG